MKWLASDTGSVEKDLTPLAEVMSSRAAQGLAMFPQPDDPRQENTNLRHFLDLENLSRVSLTDDDAGSRFLYALQVYRLSAESQNTFLRAAATYWLYRYNPYLPRNPFTVYFIRRAQCEPRGPVAEIARLALSGVNSFELDSILSYQMIPETSVGADLTVGGDRHVYDLPESLVSQAIGGGELNSEYIETYRRIIGTLPVSHPARQAVVTQLRHTKVSNTWTEFIFTLVFRNALVLYREDGSSPEINETRQLVYEYVEFNLATSASDGSVRMLAQFVHNLLKRGFLRPLQEYEMLCLSFMDYTHIPEAIVLVQFAKA
ncbi:hypothetical protein TRVA0_044S01024 [Trichomonascus vanleenenianus]|uniref:uncharacterized protein n=1 Tax=Trichomonascus vanleenenianus TaxID=2268995 RepID=UPI003ECB2826